LQVENSNVLSIFIDPTAFCGVIDAIHNECITGTAGIASSIFGGTECQYNNIRCHFTDANGSILFQGAHTTVVNFRLESNNTVEVNSTLTNEEICFINPQVCSGTLINTANCTGNIRLIGGKVANFSPAPAAGNLTSSAGITGILTLGGPASASKDNARKYMFHDCIIASLTYSNVQASGWFRNAVISAIGDMNGNYIVFEHSKVTGDISASYNSIEAYYTDFVGNWSCNVPYLIKLIGCSITGNIDTPGGEKNWQFLGTYATGTVGAEMLTVPDAAIFLVGQRSERLVPVIGQPKAWVCTEAATTMVSEGNL